MTPLQKTLARVRDEKAEEHITNHPWKMDADKRFKAGFTACQDLLLPVLMEIKAAMTEETKCPKCGSDDFRFPEYDYAFPYRGEDIVYCEKCNEKYELPNRLVKINAALERLQRLEIYE